MLIFFMNRVWDGFVFVMANVFGETEFELNCWKFGLFFGR